MPTGLIDELIRVLQRRQANGENDVYLRPEIRDAFMAPVLPGDMPRAREEKVPTPPSRSTQGRPPEVREERPEKRHAPVVDRTTPAPPTPSPPVSTPHPIADQRVLQSLDIAALRERVVACKACPLHEGRKQTVFGDGDAHARLMFIGEGPGYDEDIQGIPFVGKAGQLLTKMINAMQFDRSEVYIGNIVKCRPPKNRNPEDSEAVQCLPFLRRQIEIIAPEVIVLLGAVPLKYLLNETGINRCHGQWFDFEGIPVLPTFHPAYLLRVASKKREAWDDLKKVMVRLGKDPSSAASRG